MCFYYAIWFYFAIGFHQKTWINTLPLKASSYYIQFRLHSFLYSLNPHVLCNALSLYLVLIWSVNCCPTTYFNFISLIHYHTYFNRPFISINHSLVCLTLLIKVSLSNLVPKPSLHFLTVSKSIQQRISILLSIQINSLK